MKGNSRKVLIIDYDPSLVFYFKNTLITFPPETVLIFKNDPIVGPFNLEIIWWEQVTSIRLHILQIKSCPVDYNLMWWNNGK